MKSLGLLLLASLAILAQPALAQETGATAFALKGHTEGAANYWTLGDGTAKNPELVVPASQTITITATAVTGVHNIAVGSQAVSPEYIEEGGDPITYTFTSPATGTVEYICKLHASDMKGIVRVAGSQATTTENKSPGVALLGVSVALIGAALLVRRK